MANSVLLVEQDSDALETLRVLLEDVLGVSAVLAPDGEQALREAREKHPALVIMDMKMTGLDSLEVLRQLKAAKSTHAIPVIALAGVQKTWQSAVAAGCDDFVEKPLKPRYLLGKVIQYLYRA